MPRIPHRCWIWIALSVLTAVSVSCATLEQAPPLVSPFFGTGV
jgi:hypothetical protein